MKLIKFITREMRLFFDRLSTNLKRYETMTTATERNFKRVCKDLMLKTDISLQSLRKTFGFHYYQKTKDLLFLQNFFNQPSIAQTIDFIDLDRNLDCNFNLNFVVNF